MYNNENSKECIAECVGYYQYHVTGKFTCYHECPSTEPYHMDTRYTCYDDCPLGNFHEDGYYVCYGSCENTENNYHYTVENGNICYNNCSDSGLDFWEDGTTRCINGCPKRTFRKDGEFVCYSDCSTTGKQFSISGSDLCYGNCSETGSPYNKEGEYWCRADCQNMYRDDDGVVCRDKCSGDKPKYVHDEYICYSECPDDAPYHYLNSDECFVSCPLFYADGTQTCYTSCPDPEYPYNIEDTRTCVKECQKGFNTDET